MGKKGLVVATSVLAVMTVIFGVIGAVFLGLRRYEVDHDDHNVCRYKRSPAAACGVVAALLALVTQILASVAIGCCGAWTIPKGANRNAAIVFFIISWVLVIITVLAFLGGALLGIEGYIEKTIETGSCVGAVGGVGVFVETTFLFLIVAAFEVATYLLSRKDDHHQAATGDNPPLVPTATSKDDAYPSAPAQASQV